MFDQEPNFVALKYKDGGEPELGTNSHSLSTMESVKARFYTIENIKKIYHELKIKTREEINKNDGSRDYCGPSIASYLLLPLSLPPSLTALETWRPNG